MTELTQDMKSILAVIDGSPAAAAIPAWPMLDSDPEFVVLAGILADAMEESGHPWAAGMRRVHAGGHRPFCAFGLNSAAWRSPIDDEPVCDWIVPRSAYDRLSGHSLQWEYKVYPKASVALLELARAFTEDVA